MYSKIKIAGQPERPMLVAFPVACYTRTLLRQAGYATAPAVQHHHLSLLHRHAA